MSTHEIDIDGKKVTVSLDVFRAMGTMRARMLEAEGLSTKRAQELDTAMTAVIELKTAYSQVVAERDAALATMKAKDGPAIDLNLVMWRESAERVAGDYQALRAAGGALAEAALFVATNYDGCHRVHLAVAEWCKVVADEGGRGVRRGKKEAG